MCRKRQSRVRFKVPLTLWPALALHGRDVRPGDDEVTANAAHGERRHRASGAHASASSLELERRTQSWRPSPQLSSAHQPTAPSSGWTTDQTAWRAAFTGELVIAAT